jgi:biotin transport system ATP-binding protein
MPPIIEIEDLSHRFTDGTVGLDGIDLCIEAGSFTVIAGANGSGKTTLLRHLNGLLRPETGEVRVAGVPVLDNLIAARQQVGMVFQDADSQIVGETVAEDVAFGPENLKLSREEIRQRVNEALSAVRLENRRHHLPQTLSGGEKRRLAIAGVLAMHPRILVFDEPFANLDYPGVLQVLEQIVRLHRNGCTVVITTHDLEKVLAHADRLVFMAAGRVVEDGPPEGVVAGAERFGVRLPCMAQMGKAVRSWLN